MNRVGYDRDHERHILLARQVIQNEARALHETSENIGPAFIEAVEMIARCTGQIICCGVGKSGHVAAKIASTLSSTGTPASFLSAAEAVHGDLGGLHRGDIVVAISHSGENPELLSVVPVFRQFEAPIIAITDGTKSSLSLIANVVLSLGKTSEADPIGLAPTASSAAAMALGDAIALAVAQHHGYTLTDFSTIRAGRSAS